MWCLAHNCCTSLRDNNMPRLATFYSSYDKLAYQTTTSTTRVCVCYCLITHQIQQISLLGLRSTRTHKFNGPLSGNTWVSRYQKGKTNLDFTDAKTVSGSGISWAICKSAPRFRQITTPAPHCWIFYRPDAVSVVQPTASKHWRQYPWTRKVMLYTVSQ